LNYLFLNDSGHERQSYFSSAAIFPYTPDRPVLLLCCVIFTFSIQSARALHYIRTYACACMIYGTARLMLHRPWMPFLLSTPCNKQYSVVSNRSSVFHTRLNTLEWVPVSELSNYPYARSAHSGNGHATWRRTSDEYPHVYIHHIPNNIFLIIII